MLTHLEQFLPNNEPSSLQSYPFFWISQVNGKYTQLIEKSIKKLGIDNTRRKIILSTNALQQASITEIANLSTLKLTTATKAIYRLVEDDIVQVFLQSLMNVSRWSSSQTKVKNWWSRSIKSAK
jgi:cbb3-type cytochrome oxidase cytochrome c subunit